MDDKGLNLRICLVCVLTTLTVASNCFIACGLRVTKLLASAKISDYVTDDVTVYRYIQAAASPKDMVILIDSSGSMKGLRMEIAKATVEKIVATLSDDDFFNVVKVTKTITGTITISPVISPSWPRKQRVTQFITINDIFIKRS